MMALRLLPAIVAGLAVLAAACGGGGSSFPELQPFPPELAERLHQIRDKAAEIRGLPVYAKVQEGMISPDELRAYYETEYADLTEDERSEIESSEIVLKMLKLIDDDADLEKILTQSFPSQIAGQYLIDEDRLVLVGADSEISMDEELTLAHEYVHSMQDGAFDLSKFADDWLQSDLEEDGYAQYSATLRCVIEGDASFAEDLYAEQVFGPDWRDKVSEDAGESELPEPEQLPEYIARDFYFSYGDCKEFVRQVYEDGGWDAVNRLYSNPPDTTEQVIHFEKYKQSQLANTGEPADLSEMLSGWEMIDSSQFGEFDVYNYAVTLTGDPSASIVAAAGWGAGWARSYRSSDDPARVIVQLSLGWDSEDDLLEFLLVYGGILDGLKASVEIVDDQGNARWVLEGQHGAVSINIDQARVEMRIASDEEALTAATVDLPAFQ